MKGPLGVCVQQHVPGSGGFASAAVAKGDGDGLLQQLERVYQAKSNARKLELRMQLSQLKMGATEPLTKYVSRAKEIQAQLRAAGQDVADTEIAWSVMSGLPSAYATMATVITATTDGDLSLDDILPKLLTVMGPNPRCTN
ncbi:hypothetical protein CHLNCDRAFT_144034 [Chlorella variabilis]|uniref:Retrotransposon gag domain-containing protein n=1 Tax=Chlorella variabilis TaxID=554065 RepID=E1ZUR3_CHLVA|nr:hypothetical protein CHLNCDRAFT_144034 [Chlorella variabilis]EFN50432.1 hypothetical protein CHLNCDRAFT_144034 [Chlorella variabilis]|eukprot:XP_005842564.1 hypothetical protein CHLNCDRAFT_144034 [Chlorella variabilis]